MKRDGLLFLPKNIDLKVAAQSLNTDKADLTLKSFNGDILASTVFLNKYALQDEENNLLEYTYEDMKDRWASSVLEAENLFPHPKSKEYFRDLYDYFIPGGRQMFALGNKYLPKTTYSNCYTSSIRGDDLENIFGTAFRLAKTYSYGGGQGVDLSTLRPNQSRVSNAAKHSTGSVSFGHLFSEITNIIGQFARRGALLLSLRVDHPDIFEFIEAKHTDLNKIRYANLSIKITNEFMNAVELNQDFELRFETKHEVISKTVKARDLWIKITQAARDKAEPGLLFWDIVKYYSPSEIYNDLKVINTNPCSELPLSTEESCCLGSLILSRFVDNPYTDKAFFNIGRFRNMIFAAVRHLDNIVELNLPKHPLPEQAEKARLGRRIGLGITGLADMLACLGLEYDSNEAIEIVDKIMSHKMNAEYEASIQLASERGAFPLCDKIKHYEQPFTIQLDERVKELGRQYGQRNVSLSTVAPVGSGSLISQCSSGMEPLYSQKMIRKIFLGKKEKQYEVIHPELLRALSINPDIDKDKLFKEAHNISPDKRIELQATIQKYTDSSISSTINLPKTTTREEVADIYRKAWKSKLKGITVYREGSREGVLLKGPEGHTIDTDTVWYKFRAEGGDKFYIHISYKDGDKSKPYQIFTTNYKATEYDKFVKIGNEIKKLLITRGINPSILKKEETTEDKIEQQIGRSRNTLEKLTRFMSLAFKSGYLDEVIEILNQYAFVGSLAARLKEALTYKEISVECPECGTVMIAEGGCFHCNNCGFERCGG